MLNGRSAAFSGPFAPMRKYGPKTRQTIATPCQAGGAAPVRPAAGCAPSAENQVRQVRGTRRESYAAGHSLRQDVRARLHLLGSGLILFAWFTGHISSLVRTVR